jgi:hypothetical protein
MARKIKKHASGTVGEARDGAEAERPCIGGYSTPAPVPKHPKIADIKRGPGGWSEWLVSIEGVCTDAPIRDKRLISYRKFRNVIKFRFGIYFDPMPQAVWLASVVAAITKGSAS